MAGLKNYLFQFLTEERKEKFEKVVKYRTRHMTVVLEDIYQPHNASAVVRSCDCFGVQDLHIIENDNQYRINPQVTMGSTKWVDIHQYNEKENNTIDCLRALKAQGYKIVATSPHKDDCNLEELPVDEKFALVFGTELTGISDLVKQEADVFMKIPMYGFTESFNISVSAALCLHHLSSKIHQSEAPWELTAQEQEDVLIDWARKTVHNGDLLVEEFGKREE